MVNPAVDPAKSTYSSATVRTSESEVFARISASQIIDGPVLPHAVAIHARIIESRRETEFRGTRNKAGMNRTPRYRAHPLTTVSPRDLLLLEHLNPKPTDVALEIGVGSGSSLFQLAPATAELHGLDIAAGPVERIRRALAKSNGPRRRLPLYVLDFCRPGAAEQLPCRYNLIYSCDTVEHVTDPDTFFANVCAALVPGGRAFIAFPNEHPDIAHGITHFEHRQDLISILERAGFARSSISIGTLQLAKKPHRILQLAWYQPRRFLKMGLEYLRRRRPQFSNANGSGEEVSLKPQTFDQTDFYNLGQRLESLAPVINAYCWTVLRVASALDQSTASNRPRKTFGTRLY